MISIKSKLISKFKSKNWIHSFMFIKYRIMHSPSKPYMRADKVNLELHISASKNARYNSYQGYSLKILLTESALSKHQL